MADRRLQPPLPKALAACRKRRAIECMFGDAKTRGLNLEDTRLVCSRKLAPLMALVALAIAWAGRAAADPLGPASPNDAASFAAERIEAATARADRA